MFKVAIAFGLPIDLVIGLPSGSFTYVPPIPEFFSGDWIETSDQG